MLNEKVESAAAANTQNMLICSVADADRHMETVRQSAGRVRDWMAGQTGEPLAMLKHMKFDPVGFHPIEGHKLNIIEQINQTWTFAVAIAAARQLLLLHPDAGGFRLAPGANASQALDIMSEVQGLVGAETFAAVHPRNNGKMAADLAKLANRPERHRYVFFLSPAYPSNTRQPKLEQNGVHVWSVDI